MAREFGSVVTYKDPRGRPDRHYIDVRVDGKRFKIGAVPLSGGTSLRFRTREDAEFTLADIRHLILEGRSPKQAIAPYIAGALETLLSHHWSRFVDAKATQGSHGRQLSAKRLDELRGHERRGHLKPLLCLSIYSINYGVLEDWRSWLFDQKLAPKTVRNVIADLGTCLRWLVRRGDLDSAPELPSVQVPDHAPKIPTPETQDAILNAIPWKLRGLFLARGYMGLRPSEAARANVADWDFNASTIRVVGKGGRFRLLPADAEVARWVSKHVKPADALLAVPLFTNPNATSDDHRWTPASARRVWLSACVKVGVRFAPNEGLRHAFGTGAVNRGVTLDRTGAFLGHSDTRTTRRYAKLASSGLVSVLRPK